LPAPSVPAPALFGVKFHAIRGAVALEISLAIRL